MKGSDSRTAARGGEISDLHLRNVVRYNMDLVNKKVENKSLWEGIPPWVRRLGLRALTAEGPDSIPGWELGSYMPCDGAKKEDS